MAAPCVAAGGSRAAGRCGILGGVSTPRHLERIEWKPRPGVRLDAWPFTIPAVAQLITEGGFEVPPGVTVLVGENGSGKSTLIEAFAAVYPRQGAEPSVGPPLTHPGSPLHWHLKARTHGLAAPGGFFLRAEMMHAYLTRVDAYPHTARAWGGQRMQQRSHGESFLEVLRHRFTDRGVYFLDEPESALSFQSSLALLVVLDALRAEGSQVIMATHSPVLAALPDATLIEVGEWGLRPVRWEELDLVQSWRGFLDAPQRWLRHLLTD
jgi:predicted ATPase